MSSNSVCNYTRDTHWGTTTWRFHTGLCKFLWNISTNIWSLGELTGLKLGEVTYFVVFCNIKISELFPLDGFRFIFLLCDSNNDLLLLLLLVITVIISTELLALCDRCLGWGRVWWAGLVARLQVGQAFGVLLLPGFEVGSSSPQVNGHLTSVCDTGVNFRLCFKLMVLIILFFWTVDW